MGIKAEGMPVKPLYPTFPLTDLVIETSGSRTNLDFSDSSAAYQLAYSLKTSSIWDKVRLAGGSPGELAAVGMIGKLVLSMVRRYLAEENREMLNELGREVVEGIGRDPAGDLFQNILIHYPPGEVLEGITTLDDLIMQGSPERIKPERLILSGLILLLAKNNPAFHPYTPLLLAPEVTGQDKFRLLEQQVDRYFDLQDEYREGLNFWQFLQAPFREKPDSVYDQLSFILERWADLLDEEWVLSLRRARDILRDERQFRGQGPGPGPASVPDFSSQDVWEDLENRQFSPDLDWMPKVVLLAKNVFVWLDQLSKTYDRSIERIDQIPEEELRKIGSWGINSLWLIGLWERSPASQKIKQMTGNPEAEASAYALYDYRIAEKLGGEAALQVLRERAASCGIKLAADMVPNHVGIDSRWVVDHPDWFIQLAEPPFPGYQFEGPDLADHHAVQIFLEDHYYDQSDAAVVFKRVNRETGKVRYLYHGNDGTSMPWNDTAQLNFLNEQVRKAVQDMILDVARKFSIIRFDAAMVLAKKHFQRLWYPEPGSGGAIPSRARFGLSRPEFNRLFPREFWREVVDRAAEEAPDTLLLAEAFWMMEGYFVRSLGMHRVYNSAFMNMLKNEENAKYRSLIKETLQFDPQILKRYVNFLNNPDEDTAVSQFGKGGKYFGVCTLLATMPGLPLFGHGQIEGYSEKYGMEYRRSYLDEQPDRELLERHQREIFPLLKSRDLFAGVEHFFLYDFQDSSGQVVEDVYAYSNRLGDRSALVIYHNRWGDTEGSVSRAASPHPGDTTLVEGLGLEGSPGDVVVYRDWITGLEHLSPVRQFNEKGLLLALGAYEYHVFTDFRILPDPEGLLIRLSDRVGAGGIRNIARELQKIRLAEAFSILDRLLKPEVIASWASPWQLAVLFESREYVHDGGETPEALQELLVTLYAEIWQVLALEGNNDVPPARMAAENTFLKFSRFGTCFQPTDPFQDGLGAEGLLSVILTILLEPIRRIDEYGPGELLQDALHACSASILQAVDLSRVNNLVRSLDECIPLLGDDCQLQAASLGNWFDKACCREYLYVHEHKDIFWFQKEALLRLTAASLLYSAADCQDPENCQPDAQHGSALEVIFREVSQHAEAAGYQVQPFREAWESKHRDPVGKGG